MQIYFRRWNGHLLIDSKLTWNSIYDHHCDLLVSVSMQFETNIWWCMEPLGDPLRTQFESHWILALAVFQVNNNNSKVVRSCPLSTSNLLSLKLLPWGKEALPA